ncbi:MAG: hypothetical protein ABJA86_02115 [Nocardioidaceae bacterium]
MEAGDGLDTVRLSQGAAQTTSAFFTPGFFRDPYATYDDVRGEPVHWERALGGWVLTGYDEVAAALADPRISRGGGPREGDLLTRLLTRMMLFTDPPAHTRLRALANRASARFAEVRRKGPHLSWGPFVDSAISLRRDMSSSSEAPKVAERGF